MLYVSRIFCDPTKIIARLILLLRSLPQLSVQFKTKVGINSLRSAGYARTLYDFYLELHYAMRFKQVTVDGGKEHFMSFPPPTVLWHRNQGILWEISLSHLILQLSFC